MGILRNVGPAQDGGGVSVNLAESAIEHLAHGIDATGGHIVEPIARPATDTFPFIGGRRTRDEPPCIGGAAIIVIADRRIEETEINDLWIEPGVQYPITIDVTGVVVSLVEQLVILARDDQRHGLGRLRDSQRRPGNRQFRPSDQRREQHHQEHPVIHFHVSILFMPVPRHPAGYSVPYNDCTITRARPVPGWARAVTR